MNLHAFQKIINVLKLLDLLLKPLVALIQVLGMSLESMTGTHTIWNLWGKHV